MNNEETGFKVRIPCQHLRNKEMYYQEPGQEDDQFSSGLFWCGKTHEGVGPDNQPVSKNECCMGRSCYVG